MVTLPSIESYSSEQLAEAARLSPALERYLALLPLVSKDFYQELRKKRHRAWITAVLATLFKKNSCAQVCAFWSEETKKILTEAWHHQGLQNSDICLVAMGKLAAQELNLSSDIDIILISQDDISRENLRKVRAFLQSLTEVNTFGFCYRVDLDLRPGGNSAALVISYEQMTNHYGYQGETWERVAMVRMAPLLGPESLKEQISTFFRKFAFRKHIDYSLLNDLFSMRERIQNAQPFTYRKNLKFSKGGIRDLELFIHSLLLIHGGKKQALITPHTTTAITELENAQILNAKDAAFLRDTYWEYRRVENLIHAEGDQHTYDLPMQPTALISAQDLLHFKENSFIVTHLVDQFLAPHAKKATLISEEELDHKFKKMDLSDPEIVDVWRSLLKSEARSREKQRDENERRRFLNSALEIIHSEGLDKPLALLNLSRFLSSIKAKTSFYSLFNQHPDLLAELAWIFSCSPYLSQILIHRPEIIDSFLTKSFEIDRSDEQSFYKSLQDYKLLSDLASSSAFLRNKKIDDLVSNLSSTTDVVVQELLQDLSKKTNKSLDILTLGKWSAQEMGLKSDLDFVFITHEEPHEAHFKMARRFINFLQSPGSGKTLYPIDLRLRPTGHAGPLLMSLDDLKKYLETQGKIWERQAYQCHRLLSTKKSIPLFSFREMTAEEAQSLLDIQNQLLLPIQNEIDLKKSWGGLIHTEFTLQILSLRRGIPPQGGSVEGLLQALALSPEVSSALLSNYRYLRTQQQLLILLSDSPAQGFAVDNSSFVKLSLIHRSTPQDLFNQIQKILQDQLLHLKELDALGSPFKI